MTDLPGVPGEQVLISGGGGAGLLGRTGAAVLPGVSGEQILANGGGGAGLLGWTGMGRRTGLAGGFGERRLARAGGGGHRAGCGRVDTWCYVVG